MSGRVFAVVPAAGESRRMGRPKLLLPWGTGTVLEHVLHALDRPSVSAVVVVARAGDDAIAEIVARCAATLVMPPVPPPDMRQSVLYGLEFIQDKLQPSEHDAWLLVPADQPTLHGEWIDALVEHRRQLDVARSAADVIVVPAHAGRRGHPVLFAWRYAAEVSKLPQDCGVNHLLHLHADCVQELPIATPAVLADLDTPEDYRRLHENSPGPGG